MLEHMFVIDSIPHIQDDCKYSLEHLFFFMKIPCPPDRKIPCRPAVLHGRKKYYKFIEK